MRKFLLLATLVTLSLTAIPSHATCGTPGVITGGYNTAAAGSTATVFQQMNGCNFYFVNIFLKVSNFNSSAATNFVVNAYDNESGGACTGNVLMSWTLTVGGTHGSSDVINLNFSSPGVRWLGNGTGFMCLAVPSTTGFVPTVGFSAVFNN